MSSILLQYSKIENFLKKLQTQNNGPSGAPEPASASYWRAKTETLPRLSTFLSQLKGGPFGEKNKFSKKSYNAEKLKGGPFGILNTQSVVKHQKIEGGKFLFSEKISQCRKTVRGDPLGFSNIHSDAKQQKIERGTLWGKIFFSKKSLAVPKKMKGGTLWSRPVWYVTRKNRKNLFGSVR